MSQKLHSQFHYGATLVSSSKAPRENVAQIWAVIVSLYFNIPLNCMKVLSKSFLVLCNSAFFAGGRKRESGGLTGALVTTYLAMLTGVVPPLCT